MRMLTPTAACGGGRCVTRDSIVAGESRHHRANDQGCTSTGLLSRLGAFCHAFGGNEIDDGWVIRVEGDSH
jgi:hypothetical protein